jgi:MoxR-like ATPase
MVSILKHPASTVLAGARQLGYTGQDDKMAAARWIVAGGHAAPFERIAAHPTPPTAQAPIQAAIQTTPTVMVDSKAREEGQKAVLLGQAALTAAENIDALVKSLAQKIDVMRGDVANATSIAVGLKHDVNVTQKAVAAGAQQAADLIRKTEADIRLAIARPAPAVDPAAVAAEVSAAVAHAFKPFAQAVADAGAEAAVGNMVSASIVARKTAREVFGVTVKDTKGQPVMVDIWDHPGVPAVDPTFIWSAPILRHLLLSQATGENVWFGGDKGTGKSETARQFAARTGRGFTRINFHKYSAQEDYLGATGLQNGSTAFEPQAFLRAFTSPSTVILLDEVTNADPGNLAPLNGLLEPGAAVSIGGQVWRRAPGVLCVAADNTLGSGDQSGRYAGTRDMNSSLIDRFSRIVRFEFLPIKSEVDAVVRHTGCVPELAQHVIEAVNIARQKVATGDIVDAPSIRSVIGFIRALQMMPVAEAWESTIAARQPAESALALEAIRTASINESLIQSLI